MAGRDFSTMFREMNRIAVIGCSGAGKSTLSRQLGERLGILLVHLDRLFWKSGWGESPPEKFARRIRDAVASDRWIVDGTYLKMHHLVWPRADTIVFLDFPRAICLWRVLSRYLAHRGRARPDMTAGCPEKIDLEFIEFIWTFSADYRPRIISRLNELRADQRVIMLSGAADVTRFRRKMNIQPVQ